MKPHAFILLVLCLSVSAFGARINIQGPPGSGAFGTSVTELPNGNIVITDPDFDLQNPVVTDVGAVYLYSRDGTLISTLTGSTPGDHVGNGGITVLPNGNYVVRSLQWNNGLEPDAGAWTWCNASTGVQGPVSEANSLVGSTAGDNSGQITVLPNGNYVVSMSYWDRGGIMNAGAVTWCDGSIGRSGAVSAAISLVGSQANDFVGNQITVLSNGNFVVGSPNWATYQKKVGAVTWVSGTSGLAGEVSDSNSMLGARADDQVGYTIKALSNGHYVIGSLYVDDSNGNADVGAITWCDGTKPSIGIVTTANSLFGATENDYLSNVVPLTNGNYVVNGPRVTVGAVPVAGAWLWCTGTAPTTGTLATADAVVGSTTGDGSFDAQVIPLSNGNYLVWLPSWDNGAATDAGAVRWCNGNGGTKGAISAANSLVGSSPSDRIGGDWNGNFSYPSIFLLPNGSYIVASHDWDNGAAIRAGAVTWCNSNGSTKGAITAANSLVGTTTNDYVGYDVTVLTNGNYVVSSYSWHSGGKGLGAATWCNGATGRTGTISAANSLIGSNDGDGVGAVTALANGNYVVSSPNWENGVIVNAGATTWANGTTGMTGVVSAANSLVGTHTDDRVGYTVKALSSGNYIVSSYQWGTLNEGVITWANGTTGIKGSVTAANSLTGSQQDDYVGNSVLGTFDDGRTLVASTGWHNGALGDTGAMTLITDGSAPTGTVNASNSILGSIPKSIYHSTYSYHASSHQLAVGLPLENIVVLVNDNAILSFAKSSTMVAETAGTLDVTLTRTGNLDATVSVKLSSIAGTATANQDFASLSNQTVTFAPYASLVTVPVKILLGNASNEPNETFSLVISDPQVNAALGAITTMTVTIVESNSTVSGAPVITSPAANASLDLTAGQTLQVQGTATGTGSFGVNKVEVSLNGGIFQLASVNGSGNWSLDLTPAGGRNDVIVRSTDAGNNVSALVHRSFFVRRELAVIITGNGTVSTGFAPKSFRSIGAGVSITAKPKPGSLFNRWIIAGNAQSLNEISSEMLFRPTLTFTMRDGLELTAEFGTNPFVSNVAGTYTGLVTASTTVPDRAPSGVNNGEDGTTPGSGTEGLLVVTASSSASFSGKLTLGTLTLPVTGAFDANGGARFGTARTPYLLVPRPGKTRLSLSFQIETQQPATGKLAGQIGLYDGPLVGMLDIKSYRSAFNGLTAATTVPASLLGAKNASQRYTFVLPSMSIAGASSHSYPQGDSIGSLTLSKAGAVSGSGSLADGTPFTFSTGLNTDLEWRVFLPLYNKLGFVRGTAVFDPAAINDDLYTMSSWTWLKPVDLSQQYYPQGWPQMISIGCVGAKFIKPAGQSVLRSGGGFDLSPVNPAGNAVLTFSDGALNSSLSKVMNVSPTNAIAKIGGDSSFTATISSTGKVTGTFVHSDGTKPAYQAMILQRGINAGAYGYFLTTKPAQLNYLGESGGVSLIGQ